MLEDRPILQRSLIGFGAFSFVFTAAMSGTAFMISGGFGLGGEDRPSSAREYAVATETAWNTWTQPAYAAVPADAAPPPVEQTPTAPAEDRYFHESDYLDGEAVAAPSYDRAQIRSEADILREVERELAAYQDEIAARNAQIAQPDALAAPVSDAAIIAAKEAEAARAGYGPY